MNANIRNDGFSRLGNGTKGPTFGINGHPLRPLSKASTFSERIRRIRHLVKKEFIHIVRNRQNFKLLLIAPLMQLVLFGYACRLDVQDVTTVIVDLDKSTLSRQVTDAFSRSGYFIILDHLQSYDDVDVFMKKGLASMTILIPPDFEQKIQGKSTADLGLLIDGVDTITAGTVSGYAQSILKRFARDITDSSMNKTQGLLYDSANPRLIVPEVVDTSRAWFNPNLTSKNFFIPGVVVLILLSMSIIVTSAVIVREKETGTIEQLMVAPISRLELILGKTIPCFTIVIVTLALIVPLAFLIFDIPFRGSISFFLATALLFLLTSSGIGMTISAFCTTQQQAILTSFMFLQPSVLLSGYAFPIENMPIVVQYITYLNPLRYFITIVRGVFLKGVGLDVLWTQVAPILLMGIFYIGLASILFKRRVD
ncbi:MAG: ABC transporter permease [Deltaproteobacteria bacterium]|nr:ABC transporter permease [Deltaproteobacteria bacterium]